MFRMLMEDVCVDYFDLATLETALNILASVTLSNEGSRVTISPDTPRRVKIPLIM